MRLLCKGAAPRSTYKNLVVSQPGGASGKEHSCQCRRSKKCGFDPWVRKIPWRRKWQPTPVFLPEESHGQRSLVRSPWGCKELDMTEQLNSSTSRTIKKSKEINVMEAGMVKIL